MDIIRAHVVKNLCYITAQQMVPKGIVVHSTGANNPMLKRYVDCPQKVGINQYNNHWNTATPGGNKVCVHAFIGYDKDNNVKVAEILPLNICCWGVGKGVKGSFNYSPAYIQFEICEDGLHNENYYRKAFSVAAEYAAYLCKAYDLSVDTIVSHKEAHKKGYGSNHGDPEHWMKNFGETMDDFRNAVSEILKTNNNNIGNLSEVHIAESSNLFKDGDLVSIKAGATYYNGRPIPAWVLKQKWYVEGNSKTDRIVINKNEEGTNAICSPIHKKYLCLEMAATHNTVKSSNKSNVPYLVKVTATPLNVRKGAGTNYAANGTIVNNGVYTIVEESVGQGASLWGKLKSGAGWISLDFVKKI